jgi:hypothetical protein
LVEVRQQAQFRVYSLRPEPLAQVDEWLDHSRSLWQQPPPVRRVRAQVRLVRVAGSQAMDDMDCDNCGARMRWETSHSRCDRCGYIRPCCEGAPVSAGCVVPRAE